MGILDKAGEKTKNAAIAAGEKIKDLLVKSVESVPSVDMIVRAKDD